MNSKHSHKICVKKAKLVLRSSAASFQHLFCPPPTFHLTIQQLMSHILCVWFFSYPAIYSNVFHLIIDLKIPTSFFIPWMNNRVYQAKRLEVFISVAYVSLLFVFPRPYLTTECCQWFCRYIVCFQKCSPGHCLRKVFLKCYTVFPKISFIF